MGIFLELGILDFSLGLRMAKVPTFENRFDPASVFGVQQSSAAF
jgi:hypothetical protein